MSGVPLIYNHNDPLPRLGWIARTVAAAIAAMCLAVLIVAARLTPNASGVETHLQLGMPPCGLLRVYGVPCMTCGMTTSFSHLAHGQLLSSLYAQPAGTVFAFATAIAFWVGTYIAVTGRPSARLINQLPVTRFFFLLLGIALGGWAWKIWLVVGQHR
jgi:hypothetical protein